MKDVSFKLSDAEVLGIVGLSGSGKSTLLRAIVGILDDYTGSISLRGETLVHRAVKRPRPVRRQVQIVFQDPASSLNPRHTVSDHRSRRQVVPDDVPHDKTGEQCPSFSRASSCRARSSPGTRPN